VTPKAGERTSEMVWDLTEIASVRRRRRLDEQRTERVADAGLWRRALDQVRRRQLRQRSLRDNDPAGGTSAHARCAP